MENATPVELNGPISLPENGAEPKSAVILCHGYGSNGDDLIGLVPHLRPHLPDTVFLSPNAPEKVPMVPNGFQWFALATLSKEERRKGTYQAAPVLDHYIDQVMEKYNLPANKIVLLGFSQGTMMSLHVGLRREQPLAGILGFSGMLTAPENLASEKKSECPIFLIHGDQDTMIPFPAMFEAVGALEANGLSVERHISSNVAHGIGPDGLQKGSEFLKRVLGND